MVVCLIQFQEKQEGLNAGFDSRIRVQSTRRYASDMPPVCIDPNAFFLTAELGCGVFSWV